MVKSPCCEKISVNRGVQSAEEDGMVLPFVSKHVSSNWTSVPKKSGQRFLFETFKFMEFL